MSLQEPPQLEHGLDPLVKELATIRQNGIPHREKVLRLNELVARAVSLCRQFPDHDRYLSETSSLLSGGSRYHDVMRYVLCTAIKVRNASTVVEEYRGAERIKPLWNVLLDQFGQPITLENLRTVASVQEQRPLRSSAVDVNELRDLILPCDLDIALNLGDSWKDLTLMLVDVVPDTVLPPRRGRPTLRPLVTKAVSTEMPDEPDDEATCEVPSQSVAETARCAMLQRALEEGPGVERGSFGPKRSELIQSLDAIHETTPEDLERLAANLSTELRKIIITLTRAKVNSSEVRDTLAYIRDVMPDWLARTPLGTKLTKLAYSIALLIGYDPNSTYVDEQKALLADFIPQSEERLRALFMKPGKPAYSATRSELSGIFSRLSQKLSSSGKTYTTFLDMIDNSTAPLVEKVASQMTMLHLFQEMSPMVRGTPRHPPVPLVRPVHKLNLVGLKSKVERDELPPNLWRIQKEALGSTMRALAQGRGRLHFDAPPGIGKTRYMETLVNELNPDDATLVLEPTIQLCHQVASRMIRGTKARDVGIIADTSAQFGRQITVATYDSVQDYIQEGVFHPRDFRLVMPDEAHRGLTEQRRAIYELFSEAVIIATSASTQDINGRSVDDELDCVYRMSFVDGMRAGILNPTRLHTCEVEGSFDDKCDEALDIFDQKRREQMLIVVGNTQNADNLVEYFRRRRVNAHTVHSKLKGSSDRILDTEKAFKKGEFPVLVVCDMLAEGWDYPDLARELMFDVPGKEWEFLQRGGRVTRIAKDKPDSDLHLLYAPKERGKVCRVVNGSFGIDLTTHKNGARITEPEPGYWPENVARF